MNLVDKISNGGSPDIDIYEEGGTYKAFGVSRKALGGEPLIDFITRDGNHHAFTYSHLYDVTYNPSEGIRITFSEHVVTLKGRCLKEGYEQLMRQRVVWIVEASGSESRLVDNGQPIISQITTTPRREVLPASLLA